MEPYSQPQRVTITNLTEHQVSISWITEQPVRGTISLSATNSFPILPIFSRIFKDDGEDKIKTQGFYLTHHVTIGDLSPNTTYYFRIYEGQKKSFESKFTTISALNTLSNPSPIYGKVYNKESKKPIAGALVYFRAINNGTPSAVLSTITNEQGGWSVDLANLRTPDYQQSFTINKISVEEVAVGFGTTRVKHLSKPGNDKPWPNIGI